MDYKQYIDTYFQRRTPDLKNYFYKFCSPKEREYFGEMLSELYVHTVNNIDKIKIWIDKDEYHYYAIKYIYNQRNWSNTSFKKSITIPDSVILDDINHPLSNEIDDNMEEVYRMEYETNLKLEFLQNALQYLDYYERFVYTEYFIKKKTLRALGSEVGLSHISIHRIVGRIKTKLYNICKKQIKS
jgi:hypothetical protein